MAYLIENRRRLMLAHLHQETKSGSVVHFSRSAGKPILAADLTVTRTQSGSGAASPSNIRPIAVWNSVDVHVSATDSGGTVTSIALPEGVVAGSVDLTAGTMTVTEIKFPINGIDFVNSTSTYVQGRVYTIDSYKAYVSTAISSHLSSDIQSGYPGRLSWFQYCIYFNAPRDEVETLDTAGVQKWVQDHNVQFVALLSTPQTYTFTPGTILTLDGQNYIWTDAGNLALTYLSY